jgi:hypothetical protein
MTRTGAKGASKRGFVAAVTAGLNVRGDCVTSDPIHLLVSDSEKTPDSRSRSTPATGPGARGDSG